MTWESFLGVKFDLELLQLGSSNLHKRYMARKVSLIVIWPIFENKMSVISHVKCDYPI